MSFVLHRLYSAYSQTSTDAFLLGWSLWSKDIIFVFPPDSKTGTQAWIDAYHDLHPATVQPLPLKSGALQGALVIEYPFENHFHTLHIVYDGVNGQLPNLDLFNTAVSIAGGQMGIGANLQEMWKHDDTYHDRLKTILRGMTKQGLGYATGAHSSFMPYHIDAITLQPKGEGWEDEMALGRTIESLCRSLNNLLEHLHQSFFFYLLMQSNRFVSIGTYLPSAMLIAGNFTIMAIALWMRTGYYSDSKPSVSASSDTPQSKSEKPSDTVTEKEVTETKVNGSAVAERVLALPLTLVSGLHLLGLVPLWIFNTIFHQVSHSHHSPKKRKHILTTLKVLHRCYLHLRRCRRRPPLDSGRTTLERPRNLEAHRPPTIPFDQVVRTALARSFPLYPRYSQFLPLFHDRPPLRPSDLHYPYSRPRGCAIPHLSFGTRTPKPSVPARCSHWRLLVYRCAY